MDPREYDAAEAREEDARLLLGEDYEERELFGIRFLSERDFPVSEAS